MRDVRTQGGKTRYAGASDLILRARSSDDAVRRGDESVVLPVVAYYGAGRLWEPMRDTTRRHGNPQPSGDDLRRETSRLAGYSDCIDRRTNARDFARWMARQDQISYQQDQATLFYRMVRAVASGMVEDAEDIRYDKGREEVVVEFGGGRLVPFSMLSDGQRNLLALAGDLAVRMIRLNLPLGEQALVETPGVVLIDELDLHLHPAWQRRVVEDLRRFFPRVQFIATTHSPFIIQSLRSQELINLDPSIEIDLESPGEQSIEDITEGIMGVPVPQRSQRYMDMMHAAERYFSLLEAQATQAALAEAKLALDEVSVPFGEDPGFQALLALERKKQLGG
jgi:predicted ATP-binding protein involved in virulence